MAENNIGCEAIRPETETLSVASCTMYPIFEELARLIIETRKLLVFCDKCQKAQSFYEFDIDFQDVWDTDDSVSCLRAKHGICGECLPLKVVPSNYAIPTGNEFSEQVVSDLSQVKIFTFPTAIKLQIEPDSDFLNSPPN